MSNACRNQWRFTLHRFKELRCLAGDFRQMSKSQRDLYLNEGDQSRLSQHSSQHEEHRLMGDYFAVVTLHMCMPAKELHHSSSAGSIISRAYRADEEPVEIGVPPVSHC